MQRTYRPKKVVVQGPDPKDALFSTDEKNLAFDAFYIHNIKQSKRELSSVGSSNHRSATSKKIGKKKFVKKIVKDVEVFPRESLSGSVFLTPDKSLHVKKTKDPFDLLLNSSPAEPGTPKQFKKDNLFEKLQLSTRKLKKETKTYKKKIHKPIIKKFNGSTSGGSDSSESDKENGESSIENKTRDISDIRVHKLVIEKETKSNENADDSFDNLINNKSIFANFNKKSSFGSIKKTFINKHRLTKNLESPMDQNSPLCSTPFTVKHRGKSIYNLSPIAMGNLEDTLNCVTINDENDKSNGNILLMPKTFDKSVKNAEKECVISNTQCQTPKTHFSGDNFKEKSKSKPLFTSDDTDFSKTVESTESIKTIGDKSLQSSHQKNYVSGEGFSSIETSEFEPFLGFHHNLISKTEASIEDRDSSLIIPVKHFKKYKKQDNSSVANSTNSSTGQQISVNNYDVLSDSNKASITKTENKTVYETHQTSLKSNIEDSIYNTNSVNSQDFDRGSLYNTCNQEKSIIDEESLKVPVVVIEKLDDVVFQRYINNFETETSFKYDKTHSCDSQKQELHQSSQVYTSFDSSTDTNESTNYNEVEEKDVPRNGFMISENSVESDNEVNNNASYDKDVNDSNSMERNSITCSNIVSSDNQDELDVNDSHSIEHSSITSVNLVNSNNQSGFDETSDSNIYDSDSIECNSINFVDAVNSSNQDEFDATTHSNVNDSYTSTEHNLMTSINDGDNSNQITHSNELTVVGTGELDNDDEDEAISFVTTRRRNEISNNLSIFMFDNSRDSDSSQLDNTVLSNKVRLDETNLNLEIAKTEVDVNKIFRNETVTEELVVKEIKNQEVKNSERISFVNTRKSRSIRESDFIARESLSNKLNSTINHESNSSEVRSSNSRVVRRSTSEDTADKTTGIVLQPGKKWERSLSIYRRMTITDHFDDSILEDEDLHSKGRKYRDSVLYTMQMQDKGSLHNDTLNSHRISFITKPNRSTIRIVKEPNSSRVSLCNSTVLDDLKGFIEDCDDTVVELSKLSIADEQDITVLEKFNEANRVATARDYVLRRCNQTDTILFDECYPDTALKNCHKIGEGVYGEVFLWRATDGRARVMKIVPIAGATKVNGEHQKNYDEIISEIVIAMELSALRASIAEIECQLDEGKHFDELDLHSVENATDVFNEVLAARCVYGSYPSRLLDLWELFDECKGSENDNPAILPADQQYLVLELANAGQDLECYQFNSAEQAYALFLQVAFALAVGEESFQFEHRDLHWGNVLIAPTEQKYATFVLRGRLHRVPRRGVAATIIDYSLSRLSLRLEAREAAALYNDLAHDDGLFGAVGDYQFEVYRLMRDKLGNDWKNFEPYTNILWLHYTVDKMITALRYKRPGTKTHKQYIAKLKGIKERILNYGSAAQFVLTDNEY